MFKKFLEIFLSLWLFLFSAMIIFRIFVLTFGTLFSQTDDFYSYSLLGHNPLKELLHVFITILIISFVCAYRSNKK